MNYIIKISKVFFGVIYILGGVILSAFLDKNIIHIYVNKESMEYYALLIPGVFLFIIVLNVVKNVGRFISKYNNAERPVKEEINQLITDGPYGLMRHPLHFSLMFLPLAIALISTSFSFLLMIAPLQMFFIFLYIKWIEEPKQIRKYGEDYQKYMKDVPMFCLKKECVEILLKTVSL